MPARKATQPGALDEIARTIQSDFDEIGGHAACEARLTPKQIIIDGGTIIDGNYILGNVPYRFRRDNGRPVSYPYTGWRLPKNFQEIIATWT